jgi:hypothetical protein
LVDSQVRNEHAVRTNRCVFFLGFRPAPEMWVHSSAIMTLSAATEKQKKSGKKRPWNIMPSLPMRWMNAKSYPIAVKHLHFGLRS